VSFLVDTNVVSELVKPRPDQGVLNWWTEVDEDRLFLSVVTLAELRRGIERMPKGERRTRLDRWLVEEVPLRFEGRVLSIDATIADAWGKTVSRSETVGRPIGAMDALIASTASVHKLKLVTRNRTDFESVVEEIINPWTAT
jgi:predicted nucleic acid-binding protein